MKIPDDFDCLMYHLPVIDEWLQAKTLFVPTSSYWWTPGSSELIGLWMVAPFSGDFLAPLNNVPFVVLWGVASFALARQLGLPRAWSHATAIACLAVYTTLHELDDASNDLAIAALFMAAAVFGWRCVAGREGVGGSSRRSVMATLRIVIETTDPGLVVCGLAAGLLAGVKYNAMGYAALILGGVTIATFAKRGWRAAGRAASVLFLAAFATGGYWYARNGWISGSPLYPMGLGHDIATGYTNLWSTTFLGNSDPQVPALGMRAVWMMAGPIHLLAVVACPAMLVRFTAITFGVDPASRRSQSGKMPRLHFAERKGTLRNVWMGWLLFGTACGILVTPFCLEDVPGSLNHLRWAYTPIRYGLCFLTVAVVCLAVTAHGLSRHLPRFRLKIGKWRPRFDLGLAMWCVILLYQLGWQIYRTRREFAFVDSGLIGLNLVLFAALMHLSFAEFGAAWRRRFVIGLVAVISLAMCAGVGSLSQRWHAEFGKRYDALFGTWIFSTAGPERIWNDRLCALELRVYPFFGSHHECRVIRPRIVPSYDWLVDYLRTNQVAFVATSTPLEGHSFLYRDAARWCREHPQHFQPLADMGQYAVYRFHPDGDQKKNDRLEAYPTENLRKGTQ